MKPDYFITLCILLKILIHLYKLNFFSTWSSHLEDKKKRQCWLHLHESFSKSSTQLDTAVFLQCNNLCLLHPWLYVLSALFCFSIVFFCFLNSFDEWIRVIFSCIMTDIIYSLTWNVFCNSLLGELGSNNETAFWDHLSSII